MGTARAQFARGGAADSERALELAALGSTGLGCGRWLQSTGWKIEEAGESWRFRDGFCRFREMLVDFVADWVVCFFLIVFVV